MQKKNLKARKSKCTKKIWTKETHF